MKRHLWQHSWPEEQLAQRNKPGTERKKQKQKAKQQQQQKKQNNPTKKQNHDITNGIRKRTEWYLWPAAEKGRCQLKLHLKSKFYKSTVPNGNNYDLNVHVNSWVCEVICM